jgi:hypothetical protein
MRSLWLISPCWKMMMVSSLCIIITHIHIQPILCFVFVSGDEENDDEGMGQLFMQKRSAFKESSDRRVRAEQRKSKVAALFCVFLLLFTR